MIISRHTKRIICALAFGFSQMMPSYADENSDNNKPLPLNNLREFVEVYERIRNHYVDPIDDPAMFENAIHGLISGLDPHSNYLNEDAYKLLSQQSSGEFGGLGIEIDIDNGYIKVISPLDNTPAQRAGILAGDTIIKVDQKPIRGSSIADAVKLLRGKIGSQVVITIRRSGIDKPFDITLRRDRIDTASVSYHWLSENYAYLRISQFQFDTAKELRSALETLQQDDLQGFILDLRNNPGGLLQAAVDTAGLLLDDKLIVYTQGRITDSRLDFFAKPGDLSRGLPIIVLINHGSASAAEIVAGAMQDYHRAVILGTASFGKGSVQTIIPLNNQKTAIKLTTALYYTPKGRSIQATGIQPDILVRPAAITRINDGKRLSESKLIGHLENEQQPQASDDQKSKAPENFLHDNQVYEALNLLRGISILGTISQQKNTLQ